MSETFYLLECPMREHTFRALGASLSQARRAMHAALQAHAKAHGLPRTWVHSACAVEYVLAAGVGYRDMQAMTEAQPEARPSGRQLWYAARKRKAGDAPA